MRKMKYFCGRVDQLEAQSNEGILTTNYEAVNKKLSRHWSDPAFSLPKFPF